MGHEDGARHVSEEDDERSRDRADEEPAHAELEPGGARGLVEPERAEHEEHEPQGARDPRGRGVDLGDEEPHAYDEQGERSSVHGEAPERDEREDEAGRAGDSGEDGPRVVELGQEREDPEREEEVGDVRLCDRVEEDLRGAHLARDDRRSPELERAGARGSRDALPVERARELVAACAHGVDHALLEGLARRERDASPHGELGPVGVPAALSRERAGERRGVVDPLLLHGVGGAEGDRVRRADRRPRRHDGRVGRERDEDPRRRGARPLRLDPDDHGDVRAEERLHDLPHGQIEPSRRVEPEEERARSALLGLAELALDEARARRVDQPAQRDLVYLRGSAPHSPVDRSLPGARARCDEEQGPECHRGRERITPRPRIHRGLRT